LHLAYQDDHGLALATSTESVAERTVVRPRANETFTIFLIEIGCPTTAMLVRQSPSDVRHPIIGYGS